MKRSTFIVFATAILLGAAFLRIADLHRFPPGLHYDEAADMLLSRDVAWYGYQPFPVVTAYSGREALFYYIAAPMMRIFGVHGSANVMATRLTSAFLGILTVAATIALGKAIFRRSKIRFIGAYSLALLAGGWLAVSGPQVWQTRQGFRTSPQPLLEALGLWLLWVALRRVRRWMLPAILGGVFSGLALYVYMAARIFPVWLVIPLGLLVLLDRRWLRLKQVGVFFVALAITAIPIAYFYATHLDVFTDRLSQLAPTSDTPTLLDSVRLHLEMFFIRGDPVLRYNLAVGRPYFDPLSGLLLFVGLAAAAYGLIRWRDGLDKTSAAFLLLCPLLIAPSVIAVQGFPPSHMRSVAMVPLIFFVPALGLLVIGSAVQRWRIPRGAMVAACAVLLIALGGLTWHDYEQWGGRADLFYQADGDLNLAANWLERTPPPDIPTNALFFIASQYYEHPTVLAHNIDPKRIQWMMQEHLFLPPPDKPAIYIFPRSVNSAPWTSLLATGAISGVADGPDDQPAYLAYRYAPGQAPHPTPQVALDANVNGMLRLRGTDLPTASAGQHNTVRVYWEITRATGRSDLTPVYSLVDTWGNEIVRSMPYFEHTADWLPGEWLIEDVDLNIPPGNPPGIYTLKVAWIGKSKANDYLPLLDAQNRFAGLWADIKPLSVTAGSGGAVSQAGVTVLPGLQASVLTGLPTQINQGEHLRFTVNWFAAQAITGSPTLHLVAEQTTTHTQTVLWSGNPVHDAYPFSNWTPPEQVVDRYDIVIPPDFTAGTYNISLVLDGSTTPALSGQIQINAVIRDFTGPKLAHTVDLRLGNAIALVGYDVQKVDSQHVTVKFAWKALATPDQDYTEFVHLANPNGTLFSQHDGPPVRPTSEWVPGEIITDAVTLPIPSGDYSISVGLYLQANGLRLPVNDAGGKAKGDEITLSP